MSDRGQPHPDAAELMIILDTIPDVVFWGRYDEQTATSRIDWCNQTAAEAAGMARADILGLAPGDLLPPNVLSDRAVRQKLYEDARTYGVQELEAPVLFSRGHKDEYMKVRVVWRDPEDNRVLILARRVDAKKP